MPLNRTWFRSLIRPLGLAGIGFALLVARPAAAADEETAFDEYKVKAAYLYNLTKFVTWPDSSFPSPDSDFVIAILGADPFGQPMDQLLLDRTAIGRRIRLERVDSVERLARCHILFISRSMESGAQTILEQLAGQPVLTVSDMAGFGEIGGVFAFYLEGPNVRFEVNQSAARKSGLQVSAKLLSLAKARRR
jgi:hypothetical protein